MGTSAGTLAEHRDAGALAVPFTQEPGADGSADTSYVLGPGVEELLDVLTTVAPGVDPVAALERASATGSAGEVVEVPVTDPDGPRVLLVGLGAGTPADHRRAGAALARRLRGVDTLATSAGAAGDAACTTALVEGIVLGSFTFSLKTSDPTPPVRRVVLTSVGEEEQSAAARRGVVLGLAGWRSRTLALVPSNVKGPSWLADQAEALGTAAGLEVEVWDEERLRAEGCGGLLGVGQASDRPPRLVRLTYTPATGDAGAGAGPDAHVVLVGKGITFDSGGLSIKPADAMATMKRDMTGGAVVISVMAALAEVGCPVKVVGLVPAAENAVSGDAMRPSDVLRHWGGRTSEVNNTDAEGRLVLADALAYAVATLDPAVVVDVATLTGAMKVALGQRTGGFFANREGLAAAIAAAGEAAGEPLWRFPLAEVYEEKIASKVADADNAGGGPGAITAALFLQHFVGDVPWAHLDVASAGDSPDERFEWTTGPTGFGARALLAWLGRPDPLAEL